MTFDWAFFWDSLFTPSPAFLHGFLLTIVISVVSMALALVLGLFIALLGRSRFVALRAFAATYVWAIRGTPVLVLLVIIYLGLASAGLFRFDDAELFSITVQGAIQAAIVGLTIDQSAYVSEIVRAGLEAVDEGQHEASAALGMTPVSALRWIVVPQALRTMVPPLGNQFNILMKTTSILSIIGVSEMFLVTQSISSVTFKTFEILIVVALYYLLLTTAWTLIQVQIERKLNERVGIYQGSLLATAWSRMRTLYPTADPVPSGTAEPHGGRV
jgi:polar amino acid transport system permease protein